MRLPYSFRFVDDKLNRRLLELLKRSGVEHTVDPDGIIHYSSDEEQFIENDLIAKMRGTLFSSWQILSCPKGWIERYKQHMLRHDIPFVEELIDNKVCFLIPRKYRPHSWKFQEARRLVS